MRHARSSRAALLVIVGLVAVPSVVFAHAQLELAEPAPGSRLGQPPTELRLTFSEAVDASFSQIEVLDERRQRVDGGDSRVAQDDPRVMRVSLQGGLPDGIYTVAWRTLSAVDGHTANGAYPLLVGNVAAGAATATSSEASFSSETAVSRWSFSLAASVMFGALLSWKYVLSPLLRGPNVAARLPAAAKTRQLVLAAGVVLLLATVYGAVAQAASAGGVPLWGVFGGAVQNILTRGRFPVIFWPRLVLVLLSVALVRWQDVDDWGGDMALSILPGALLTSSLTSHGAALTSGPYLGIAVDWLHFLGVGAWIGGLAALVVVLPHVLKAGSPTATADARLGDRVLGHAVRRFSQLAVVSVIVIAVSGTFQTWLEVGNWEGLFQTTYGRTILAKIALMALMLLFGSYNLVVAGPRLVRLAGKALDATAVLARGFRLSIRVELALGIVVLGIAAVLTGLTPGREELAREASGETQAGPVDRPIDAPGLAVRAQISPAVLGVNRFAVQLQGTEPSTVERVQLTLTFLDAELGSQPLLLDYVPGSSPPTWQAESPLLSQAGRWQAELLVRRANQDDVRSAVRFLVTGPGTAPATTAAYPLLPSPLTTVAYGLLLAGLLVVLVAFVRGGRRVHRTQVALLGAGLVIVLCAGYVYAQEQRGGVPLDVTNIRNPIPPDQRSLTAGKQIYDASCAACHGDTGRGDGPAGIRLVPRPADLRVHMAAGHTDGQLFYWVSYGVAGTDMPAWRDKLSEEERWQVINYIRTFANAP